MPPRRAHLPYVLVIALLASAFAQAQAQAQAPASAALAGQVTSAGAPAAGVTVRAVRAGTTTTAATTVTAADGKYRLGPVAQGVYRIEFTGDGFQPVIRAGIVVFADSTAELNIELAGTPRSGEVTVRIETKLGSIDLVIDTTRAPVTAANFLKYVDGGFYDGGRFHRATRPDNYTPAPPNRPMMEIIQGGINPERRSQAFPSIALERTSVTGLKHLRGTVSMARGAVDSATSDFFILLDDQPSLDFGGRRFDDGQGGAAFGRVIAGLEIVRRIQQQPVQGQNLTPPVPIVRIARIK